jgi:hypothetical protein
MMIVLAHEVMLTAALAFQLMLNAPASKLMMTALAFQLMLNAPAYKLMITALAFELMLKAWEVMLIINSPWRYIRPNCGFSTRNNDKLY